jgi:hypothetical protein
MGWTKMNDSTPLNVEKMKERKSLAIVALGPSSFEYFKAVEAAGAKEQLFDQVWTVNTYASVMKADIVFHMDDIRVQMARAEKNEKIRHLVEHLRTYQGRVITSRTHPDFPCLEAFPLQEAANEFKCFYFNNTVAYAMAYAIMRGEFNEIVLYGCDYHYTGESFVEPGRACLEFWIGRAWERGIRIHIAPNSSLMDTNAQVLYGYDTVDVAYKVDDNGLIEVKVEEKKDLELDADAIEQRYCHALKEPVNV